MKPKLPPFTKQELIDYIAGRGYTITPKGLDDLWDVYVRSDFCYALGKIKCRLVNWKNDVNLKIRNGYYTIKPISKPEPPKSKDYPRPDEIITLEQRKILKAKMDKIGRMPPHGHRKIINSRNENLDKLE